MEAFFEQFKSAQDKAKCQNMDQQELATHYLSALGDNTFTQIILDIHNLRQMVEAWLREDPQKVS